MSIIIYIILVQALDEKEKPGGGKKGGAAANINLASFTGVLNHVDLHADDDDDEDVLDVIPKAYIAKKSCNDQSRLIVASVIGTTLANFTICKKRDGVYATISNFNTSLQQKSVYKI